MGDFLKSIFTFGDFFLFFFRNGLLSYLFHLYVTLHPFLRRTITFPISSYFVDYFPTPQPIVPICEIVFPHPLKIFPPLTHLFSTKGKAFL